MANSFPLLAQDNVSNNLEIGLQQHVFVFQNSSKALYNSSPTSLNLIYWRDLGNSSEIDASSALQNKDYRALTNKLYNYPLIGIYFSHLGNLNSKLGRAYTLGLATDISIWQKENNYFSIRPKLGLSYFTQKYNPIVNPNNDLIGSNFNINLALGFYYTIQVPIKTVKLGLEFNHYSNGAISKPNYGMNLFSGVIAYQIGPKLFPWVKSEKRELIAVFNESPKLHQFNIQVGGFSKQLSYKGTRFTGFHGAASYHIPVNAGLDFNTKLDISLDPSRKKELTAKGLNTPNNLRSGLSVGFTGHFHKFNLSANAGVYLYKPESELDAFWYQNYQIDYKINKNIYLFISLLAHTNTADFLSFGLGYTL